MREMTGVKICVRNPPSHFSLWYRRIDREGCVLTEKYEAEKARSLNFNGCSPRKKSARRARQ